MTSDTEQSRCCRRRGRPRVMRQVSEDSQVRCYAPQCCPHEDNESVVLLPEELELLKLIDLDGMEQEEAAGAMGVSRKTVWRDLHEARRKITDALVNGKAIEVDGCPRKNDGRCPRWTEGQCPRRDSGFCPRDQPETG